MKNLNLESVQGTPLEPSISAIVAALCSVADGALQPADVHLVAAPPHTGADVAFGCFPLAKARRQNPAQIAQEFASALAAPLEGSVERLEAAGPYLNLWLARGGLSNALLQSEATHGFGHSSRQEGERVMVEYVSPNTNKPLHLGHIRNAVLGRAVGRLVQSQGAEVFLTDIINDRGIHIAKSMIAYRKFADGETPASSGLKGDHLVGRYYVRFDQELSRERATWEAEQGIDSAQLDDRAKKKADEQFNEWSPLMQETRELLVQWEAEDPAVRELWRTMNSWVYAGFAETYELLGIHFDKHYYESDIYQGGREIILAALERGVFEQAPNGAVIAPLSQHGDQKLQDKVVLRGDGTGLYITQDINLATIKFEEYQLTRSLYVIGSEQDFYMRQLRATLELLEVPWASGVHHLSYGMVYLPEGKMKSREGKVVDADELVAELAVMARAALDERLADSAEQASAGDVPNDEELERRALAIALSAITFNFLVVGRETDIQFDPRSSLSFEGKTGPYLQYTGARIASILRKAKAEIGSSWQAPSELAELSEAEWQIVKALALFPLAVTDAAESYDPARLANALFELGQTFNAFYHDHRVLDADEPERSTRLALLRAVLQALRSGMELLGIEPLDEM